MLSSATDARPTISTEAKLEAPRDTTREVFETVVFVVVLVLMLKLFVAEAFVIPTGSMASTLWGDQVRCTCRECGYKFPINASDNGRDAVVGYICENCGFICVDRDASQDLSSVKSGDRVLVSKYEYHLREPKRFEVPVFKFPVEPFSPVEKGGMNYIKRLVGLSGETVAVFNGDLYTCKDLTYQNIPQEQRPPHPEDAWQFRYMYTKDPAAKEHFRAGKFEIVRKSPDEILAVRRIVFDLDHQPTGRQGVRRQRWHSEGEGGGWQMEQAGFNHSGNDAGWMRYQHINPWDDTTLSPFHIVDFISYNVPRDRNMAPFMTDWRRHWVSDLIVDCKVELTSADSEFTLELAKGRDRFQAVFIKGECQLNRITTSSTGQKTEILGSHATKIDKAGKYDVRFANVDSRLTVWVDGRPISFSKEQTDYAPPDPRKAFEPFDENDLQQPARIGAKGDVKISKVSLWRDLLYRCAWESKPIGNHRPFDPMPGEFPDCDDVETYYVQPGHYLMFGDNINSSSDSRLWGLVPERLLLGRAVMIYWPIGRMGVIE